MAKRIFFNWDKLTAHINWFVVGFLLVGMIYKIAVTWNGNFIFQIDNARDWVDLRDMIQLGNIRLTGPISAIEGLYNGPFWYYLLTIPYLLSGGNPYSGVLLMIFLWAVGGYFLYLITKQYGFLSWFSAQLLWLGSPYIGLTTVYSFNPNPILFLFPVFIYYLAKYLEKKKLVFGLVAFGLAGFFFNLEMLSSLFYPIIILVLILLTKNLRLLKNWTFWLSVGCYSIFFLPQLLFDLRHQFLMYYAGLRYLSGEGVDHARIPFIAKILKTWNSYLDAFLPTFLNSKLLMNSFVLLVPFSLIIYAFQQFMRKKITEYFDQFSLVAFIVLLISFIGFVVLPVGLNSWHFGPLVVSAIVLFAFTLFKVKSYLRFGFVIGGLFMVVLLFQTTRIIWNGSREIGKTSNDPSNFANELKAIDYIYQKAEGKNFKAYAYLPSVIDYPYQYLFWWYGLKKYHYTPTEYAYLPNKPEYIANKEQFNSPNNSENSTLIFLIKEPDRIKMRAAWEGEFTQYPLLEHVTLGPLEIETRSFSPQSATIETAQ